MNGFDGFSESATLYAENLSVVSAMEQAMHESISEFLDALSKSVCEKVGTIEIDSHDSRGWRYFGIVDTVCWVSFDRRKASIVFPGRIKCYVGGPMKRSAEDVNRILTLLSIPEIVADGWRKDLQNWCILNATIEYGPTKDFELLASVIARMLRHIATAFGMDGGSK